MSLSRRGFLVAGTVSLAGAVAGAKVIDCHTHLTHHGVSNWSELDRRMVDAADRLGIDQLCCSILTEKRDATPELFRECNQWVAEAIQRFPGRILGYCFVNPGHGREALEEVRRSVDRGFIGIKLYNTYFANEPVVYPVVELAIQLRIPILHHAGHTMWLPAPQPRISDGSHLSELARRYPEAMLICAHICGGGDWEWEIKSLRNAPGVYLDTSGSVADEGVVEMAHRILGPERLLFATDLSMTASVGRMRGAQIPAADKRAIFGGNFQKILSRRGAR